MSCFVTLRGEIYTVGYRMKFNYSCF
eukprot:COSAG02_NODE_48415_length_334_cov_0.531915_2_plen_25_part_01